MLRGSRLSPSLRSALRVGFAWLLVSAALGIYMLVRGLVIWRADGDLAGAFAFSPHLKTAHTITLAGIVVLPVLAWLAGASRTGDAARLRLVRLGALGYSLLSAALVTASLAQLPAGFVHTSLSTVGGVGVLLLGGALIAAPAAHR